MILTIQLITIPRQAAPTVPQIVLLTVHQPAVLQVPALLLYPMQHSLLETYVWGGTSLTSGADCSGFVQSVYANFGVSLPRTSYEQQNAGYEVSYADAQPGDLICYGGHVAIYMGNGQIVHASNARDGIKVSDNAAYRTITSVRRLV